MAKRMYKALTRLTIVKTGKVVEEGETVDLGHLDVIKLRRLEMAGAVQEVIAENAKEVKTDEK